jgi:hypothetical protein
MLILTWVGIIFVKILHLALARCKIMTNIMPTHVKISIEPDIRELFLKQNKMTHCLESVMIFELFQQSYLCFVFHFILHILLTISQYIYHVCQSLDQQN